MRCLDAFQITLRVEVAPRGVPAHVDCLLGAGRPASRLDGGALDRALRKWGGGFRAVGVYASRQSLGHAGSQHVGFDDLEHELGLARTYRVQLVDREAARAALAAARDLHVVEHARAETLATTGDTPAPGPAARGAVPGHEIVKAAAALAREPGDERVVVAVVDTGVALGHPELRRKLLAGYDTVDLGMGRVGGMALVGDSRGADFMPRDEVGHGSHVAGVAGAQGYRMPRGIAGRALVVPVRVLAAAMPDGGRRPIGVGGLSDIDCGIKVAVDLGAKVLNMSFGTSEAHLDTGAPPPHADVIRYAAARGCILVAAMGNSGRRERLFPAGLESVIAVASVDGELRPSAFSTRGDHVALAAPGERILSLDRHGYKLSSGTSHAAPYVAGACALLVSAAHRRGRDLDGATARRLLVESAQARPAEGFREDVGHGVLDVDAALRALERELDAPRSRGIGGPGRPAPAPGARA